MDINYELYKVFYCVATTLSFSDASRQLFISQSAVSQSVKTLERKLGQPLFARSTKKVPVGRYQKLRARTAAHRRDRHHLPLPASPLFKTIPRQIPYRPDQGH